MKLGVLVEAEEGVDWEEWRNVCRRAEELGFDSVWISDHLFSPWVSDRHGLDAWMALAVVAAETRRVTLGPLVSPITFRQPALVARMAESLHDLSHGRFVLGLGLGWNADEHRAVGIAFPPVAERSEQLLNAIRLIRRLHGARHIPILIGGKGLRSTLPLVARCADQWNVTTSSAVEYRALTRELDRLCGEVGRDPREIRRSAAVGYLIGRNAVELRERSERMRKLVPPLADAEDVSEAARHMGWVAGTPDEVLDALHALEHAGVQQVILGQYDVSDLASLELIAHDILPAVR